MSKLRIKNLSQFLADKDMQSLKKCGCCKKDVPLSEFNVRKRQRGDHIYFGFRSECNTCITEYFSRKKTKEVPDWALSAELYDTYAYGQFLIRAFKNPKKKCPNCNEIKHKIHDFAYRKRGIYYTCSAYCNPCKLIINENERQRNLERVRKSERIRHHKESKSLSTRYVKKQIQRKKRSLRYKKEPLLVPTESEQRLSCAKWRVDTIIKKLCK